MAKKYQVSLNDKPIDTMERTSLTAAKEWVKRNVTSTHMGEWRKLVNGYEYATTIGQYYKFEVNSTDKTG